MKSSINWLLRNTQWSFPDSDFKECSASMFSGRVRLCQRSTGDDPTGFTSIIGVLPSFLLGRQPFPWASGQGICLEILPHARGVACINVDAINDQLHSIA